MRDRYEREAHLRLRFVLGFEVMCSKFSLVPTIPHSVWYTVKTLM